jgi:hypothetical protein
MNINKESLVESLEQQLTFINRNNRIYYNNPFIFVPRSLLVNAYNRKIKSINVLQEDLQELLIIQFELH